MTHSQAGVQSEPEIDGIGFPIGLIECVGMTIGEDDECESPTILRNIHHVHPAIPEK